MSRLFLIDPEGRPLADTPTPAPEASEVEQQTLDEFYKFCEEEARRASTPQEKHAE